MAVLIVVLDGAHVIELGSHQEQMARDGLYAELYTTRLELTAESVAQPQGASWAA